MKFSLAMCLTFLALVSLTTGCKSLFPTEDKRTVNQWSNFDDTQRAFDKIVPLQTTIADLRRMGLDPHTSPNIHLLSYLDVIRQFIPNQSITKDDLPADVKSCIECKDCCQAYELSLDIIKNKRYGNIFLDVLSFKRNTHTTGWNFKGLIVIKDGLVAYKLISGEPSVDRLDKKIRPLGPIQELDNWIKPRVW